MLYRCPPVRRRGTTLVESAIIYSTTVGLILGLIFGVVGVFSYNEVAHLAREGARYASTHGGQYYLDAQKAIHASPAVPNTTAWQTQLTNEPQVTSSSDLRPIILKHASLLDAAQLTVTVSWTAKDPST